MNNRGCVVAESGKKNDPIAKRLIAQQAKLAEAAKSGTDVQAVMIETLGLIAEGVAKSNRDIHAMRQKKAGKKAVAAKPKV
ncbi:hypothetical protein [Hansschlegelia zhihuaiae]|uniref:Uncharacterized protein n=1 Tax=Hansschlegelia zhihuaiae TaxID=405005 RepID=A0A4Q0M475_9HYPH|nr:hypothetical protein [Hansschlegelia zhihuaiae]RXF67416.1 hypothetical protein EK403_21305 [Hansschlegelia zhihuaiae]